MKTNGSTMYGSKKTEYVVQKKKNGFILKPTNKPINKVKISHNEKNYYKICGLQG